MPSPSSSHSDDESRLPTMAIPHANPWAKHSPPASKKQHRPDETDFAYVINDNEASPSYHLDANRSHSNIKDGANVISGNGYQDKDQVDHDNDDDDDDDDDFLYTGIDQNLTANGSGHADDNESDSYSAKLRDILGSDDELQDGLPTDVDTRSKDDSQPSAQIDDDGDDDDDESFFQYPQSTPHDASFDTHFNSTQSPLPTSPPAMTSRSSSAARLSSLPISLLPFPQRPAAYPHLSRLRSSAISDASQSLPVSRQPSVPGTNSPSSIQHARTSRPLELTSSSASNSIPQLADSSIHIAPSASSIRSRNSSFSVTLDSIHGRKRRRPRSSFPYGPSVITESEACIRRQTQSDLSIDSKLETDLATLDSIHLGSDLAVRPMSMLKETKVANNGELKRDFVKWSALRNVVSGLSATSPNPELQQPSEYQPKPTVLTVASGLIAVGTGGGKTVVFDSSQQVKCVCGHDGHLGEGDAVTALAFSSDHTFLGVGHESGNIFLYDLSSPHRPARHVPPVSLEYVKLGKKEGHLSGSRIVHIGFIGLRHTAIVTADNKGLSFYHALGKILGVSSNDTLRLLGKYPQFEHEEELGLLTGKKSCIFGMATLPLGPRSHLADEHHFVALLTPSKMVLVGLKPFARTWYRKLNSSTKVTKARKPTLEDVLNTSAPPREAAEENPYTETQTPGCLAWFPANSDTDSGHTRRTNPILAFSFGHRFHLLGLIVRRKARTMTTANEVSRMQQPSTTKPPTEEIVVVELTDADGVEEADDIIAMQWFNSDLLMLVTKSSLALFDCRKGKVTERMKNANFDSVLDRLVEHKWFNSVLGLDRLQSQQHDGQGRRQRSWAVSHSVKICKGKAFFLTDSDLIVGTLLSWADHVLQYVVNGDFLSAIALATVFYKGNALGSAVGLPSDESERKQLVGQKIHELMIASTEYLFSPDRLTDSTHVTADGRGVDRTSVFEGLAQVCARACLALDDLPFLFETLYDRYEDNGIEGIFVGQMEAFIVSGELRTLPIPVVQRLIAFRKKQEQFDLAEKIIWHVDPKCLDVDQALSLCLDQKLYDALIYAYNSALDDYVSPIIELLVPLRQMVRLRRRLEGGRASKISQHTRSPTNLANGSGSLYVETRSTYQVDLLATTDLEDEKDFEDAYKVFSYLSVVLTGSQYPSQEPISSEEKSNTAKTLIYAFVFSGRCMIWPPGPGGRLILFGLSGVEEEEQEQDGYDTRSLSARSIPDDWEETEPIYPYLRLFLEFDAEAFLDALDIALEDSFLDNEDLVGKRISRQLIIDILLEFSRSRRTISMIFKDDESDRKNGHLTQSDNSSKRWDKQRLPSLPRIFINIFVARNAPKYPQFIKLSQPDVDYLLRALSLPLVTETEVQGHLADGACPSTADLVALESTREDRQLAVEYLLSTYRPAFDDTRLAAFEKAGFTRILQSAFRQEKKWDKLLAIFLQGLVAEEGDVVNDATTPTSGARNREEIFFHIEQVLVKASRAQGRAEMMPKLHELLMLSSLDLLHLNPLKTVELMDRFFPTYHTKVIEHLRQLDESKLVLFLECFFEPLEALRRLRCDSIRTEDDIETCRNAGHDATHPTLEDGAAKASHDTALDHDLVVASPDHLDEQSRDLFIELLCRHDPDGVVRNLDARPTRFFDLETVIMSCRQSHSQGKMARVAQNGDAILWCLDRLGRAKEAFDELDKLVAAAAASLGATMSHMENAFDNGRIEDDILNGLLVDIRKAVDMAVRLCIERANRFGGHDSDDDDDDPTRPGKTTTKGDSAIMNADEVWFRLLRCLVRLVHDVANLSSLTAAPSLWNVEGSKEVESLPSKALSESRAIVQDTLSALVSSTAAEAVSFPDLFKRLIGGQGESDQSSTVQYYTEIRSVLDGMLSAYRLRSDLLGITNKLFERDTFNQLRKLAAQRKRGWRPMDAQARCQRCGLIVVGNKRGTLGGALADADESKSHQDDNGAGLGSPITLNADPASPQVVSNSRRSSRADLLEESSLRKRVLRNGSSSSPFQINTTMSRRLPKSPYDEKAAPLASPRTDKGKGVDRSNSLPSSSSSLNGNGFATTFNGDSDSDGVGSYFSRPLTMDPDENSTHSMDSMLMWRSSSSVSLRIEEVGSSKSCKTPSVHEEEATDDATITSLRRGSSLSHGTTTPQRIRSREASIVSYTSTNDQDHEHRDNLFPTSATTHQTKPCHDSMLEQDWITLKAQEPIVVIRSGQMYHQSCYREAETDTPGRQNWLA